MKFFLFLLIFLFVHVSCDEGSSSSNQSQRVTQGAPPAVPEPTGLLLYGAGVLILAGYLRRGK